MIKEKNIKKEFITLHVGAGTFKPVKTDTMVRHEMHAEFIEVSVETIQQLIDSVDKKIIPVGTTSMRTIESLYWLGVKLSTADSQQSTIIPELNQWEAYDLPQNISPKTALQTLLDWLKKNQLLKLITRTRIIIAPGYQLRISKGLVTNFHQPQSTLLLLIAAVVGDDWRKIYDHALENNYRFLSYGDGCLLFPRF